MTRSWPLSILAAICESGCAAISTSTIPAVDSYAPRAYSATPIVLMGILRTVIVDEQLNVTHIRLVERGILLGDCLTEIENQPARDGIDLDQRRTERASDRTEKPAGGRARRFAGHPHTDEPDHSAVSRVRKIQALQVQLREFLQGPRLLRRRIADAVLEVEGAVCMEPDEQPPDAGALQSVPERGHHRRARRAGNLNVLRVKDRLPEDARITGNGQASSVACKVDEPRLHAPVGPGPQADGTVTAAELVKEDSVSR